MRVFVTGATGWIGSHAVDELLEHGHQVLGLARSDRSAAALQAKGAEPFRGDLADPESIARGAALADAVVHLANTHDFANPVAMNAAERAATQAIGEAVAGTDKPWLLASGTALPNGGRPLTERDRSPFSGPDAMRGGSENLALDFVEQGAHTVIGRFAPTVHGMGDQGFIAFLVNAAKQNGEVLYAGDGSGRWSAGHVTDTAKLIRLGIEHAPAGSILHGAAEDGVRTLDIATAISDGLGLPLRSSTPEEMAEKMGFIGQVFAMDIPASSEITRELIGWEPTGPTLLDDIAAGAYFPV